MSALVREQSRPKIERTGSSKNMLNHLRSQWIYNYEVSNLQNHGWEWNKLFIDEKEWEMVVESIYLQVCSLK